MFDKVLNIPNFQKFENAKQSNKKIVLIYPNNQVLVISASGIELENYF